MRIVVLDGYCLNPGDLNWGALRGMGDLQVHDRTPADEVAGRLRGARAALTNKTPLRAALLRELPELRYIGVLATGYDIVDIGAARELGITVTNIPTYGTASVAQFVFALMLELCHGVGEHNRAVRAGEWSRSPDWSFWKSPQVELAGKTLGVVGFGRIGRQVGRIGDAMGMRIAAYDTVRTEPPPLSDFRWLELDQLLRESDVVSLNCSLTPENHGLINARRLALMKPSAFLINASRGRLVVAEDLAAALNEGRLAGAALDVLPAEPPPAGAPLLTARNCIVTPHIAWATREARARLLAIAIENLRAWLAASPANVVS